MFRGPVKEWKVGTPLTGRASLCELPGEDTFSAEGTRAFLCVEEGLALCGYEVHVECLFCGRGGICRAAFAAWAVLESPSVPPHASAAALAAPSRLR